jgi:hypothetical protein
MKEAVHSVHTAAILRRLTPSRRVKQALIQREINPSGFPAEFPKKISKILFKKDFNLNNKGKYL